MTTMTLEQAFALGLQHHRAGRLAEAETIYQQILSRQPSHAEALHALGIIACQAGRHEIAAEQISRALLLNPHNPIAHSNLGECYRLLGRLGEAEASFRRAIQLGPGNADAYSQLGLALKEQGQFDEAATALQHALQLQPNHAKAHFNLGTVFKAQGQLDEAVNAFRAAVEIQPDYAEAYNNLANALKDQGELISAFATYRRSLALKPDQAAVHSNLIFTLHMHPEEDRKRIGEEHERWNSQFSVPRRSQIQPHLNDPNPDRRLKIGYVSSTFCFHAVAFFLLPLLKAHDHGPLEIHCYSSTGQPDAITERLRQTADVWREVRGLSDLQLADQVRSDGIDILVDLSMHAGENHLLTFARQPAPLQVSWLAYPGTSGLDTIQYRLTDAVLDPPEQDNDLPGGRPVRLPNSWCCYAPVREFPPVSPLPAAHAGAITFGSLNRFCKLHETQLACWARLLQAIPESRIVIICPPGRASERTYRLFAAHGVDKARVELVAPCAWPDYIALFQRIDVMLDISPCNGMTTTCHALWMGVPVITLAGASAVSRAGRSLLHAAGLPEWVGRNEDEYLRIAAQWAADFPRLAQLRATLRSRMQTSPLMDAPRFARHIEAAYRTIWRQWCKQP